MRKVLANMVMRVFPQTSTHYFFLDRKFSPFVNLRVGGFAMFNAKKVGTKEKYSLSKDKQSFSLLVSPSVGVKMHITPNIGIMASISDEAYLLNAFVGCFPNRGAKMRFSECQQTRLIGRA